MEKFQFSINHIMILALILAGLIILTNLTVSARESWSAVTCVQSLEIGTGGSVLAGIWLTEIYGRFTAHASPAGFTEAEILVPVITLETASSILTR